MKSQAKYTAYLIPHTHWDREWYQPFRVFQLRLADVVDSALDLLRDPAYRRYTLDGQAIVLEDYLELRPHREAELRQQVQAGRLRIGPWYVLADEFLVSPESLVRNLQIGREVCSRFGSDLKIGYTPDSFGHISQLPLLVSGFGLDSIVFQRGVGDEGERLGSEFEWVAADGSTSVFAAHLIGTYSGATALGHVSWELIDDYDSELAEAHLTAALYGEEVSALAQLPEWLRLSLERVDGGLVNHASGDALVLMNGSDHLFPQPNLQEVVSQAGEWFPEIAFIQGDIEEYVAAARESAEEVESYQGEFRGSRYHHILAGVLSARLYLKQANHAAESLLERYAEPMSALAFSTGGTYPQEFLRLAWRILLQNHPHDSMCGCSIDSVHREMMTRFDNVMQIGEDICRRAMLHLGDSRPLNVQDVSEVGLHGLTVFNPVPFAYTALVSKRLELPVGEAANIVIRDEAGQTLPVQLESELVYPPGQSGQLIERTTLNILAPLGPLGLTSLSFSHGSADSTQARVTGTVRGETVRIATERVALEVNAVGRAVLTDLQSGTRHDLNFTFEDTADAGDEYDYSPLPGDEPIIVNETAAPPRLLKTGPLVASVELEYILPLPRKLSSDRRNRTGLIEQRVSMLLTLQAGSPLLDLKVSFNNQSEDHRLRLVVSSDLASDTVWADGHFDVLERPVERKDGRDWFQIPPPTTHQRRFVCITDGDRSLAVLNRGLPEYECRHGATGVDVAVTLVRSIGWLSRDDLISRPQGAGPALPTPEAQCLGEHMCELAVHVMPGNWWHADLLAVAQTYVAPPVAYSGLARQAASLFTLHGNFELTAVKRADDRNSLIVRVVNPGPESVRGWLEASFEPVSVWQVRLDETRLEPIQTSPSLELTLAPRSVKTFEFELEGGSHSTTPAA